MRTVVPIGGKVTPLSLLGRASADFSAAEVECVGLALAVDVGAADVAEEEDGADPVLAGDTAVLWVAAPAAEVVELDDAAHPVSSSTSEPNPVATVHPLLRMTCLLPGLTPWL
jgi:hypothetical protein